MAGSVQVAPPVTTGLTLSQVTALSSQLQRPFQRAVWAQSNQKITPSDLTAPNTNAFLSIQDAMATDWQLIQTCPYCQRPYP